MLQHSLQYDSLLTMFENGDLKALDKLPHDMDINKVKKNQKQNCCCECVVFQSLIFFFFFFFQKKQPILFWGSRFLLHAAARSGNIDLVKALVDRVKKKENWRFLLIRF